jgi:hypothetical protein
MPQAYSKHNTLNRLWFFESENHIIRTILLRGDIEFTACTVRHQCKETPLFIPWLSTWFFSGPHKARILQNLRFI